MGSAAREGRSVSTTSWQGAERTRLGPALARSKRSPSRRSFSNIEPGMRRSRSLATRADSSSRRSTPRAAAIRSDDPKALMSTGISEPRTFSKRRATLRPPALLDTRSAISAISRSRETGALTRRSQPCLSRWPMNSRRSPKAMAARWTLLVEVDLDEPAGDDGEDQARGGAHRYEAPAHERSLPRDDALHAEEGPRGHVRDQGAERHARVRQHHEQGHAHHRAARGDHARRARDEDGAQPRLLPEVAPDRLLRDHHLDHPGEDQGRHQARDDEPEQGEAVAGAHRREARILRVGDEREDDGQRGENHEGNVEESGPRHGGIIRHVGYTDLAPSDALDDSTARARTGTAAGGGRRLRDVARPRYRPGRGRARGAARRLDRDRLHRARGRRAAAGGRLRAPVAPGPRPGEPLALAGPRPQSAPPPDHRGARHPDLRPQRRPVGAGRRLELAGAARLDHGPVDRGHGAPVLADPAAGRCRLDRSPPRSAL